MNNVSENQLLLMVARRDLAGNLRPLVQRELNWDYLFATAQAHGLLPLLHKHFTSAADLIPNHLLSRLKRESVANSQNVLRLIAKQLRVYKLFKESNIPSLYSKDRCSRRRRTARSRCGRPVISTSSSTDAISSAPERCSNRLATK